MLMHIAGRVPMQEDFKSAFEKLLMALVKNVPSFALTKTLCEWEAYVSITTTDDQVHAYIISLMEAIHKLPRIPKWEGAKPKGQAINTGAGATETLTNEGKGKSKGKGKGKGPPLPDNSKAKGGKGKGKGKSQSKQVLQGHCSNWKGWRKPTATLLGVPLPEGTRVSGDAQKKRPRQRVYYASPAGCLRGKNCIYLHQNDSVTKKPLPADAADVQRLKGKPQAIPKATASVPLNVTPGPAMSSTATSSTTPPPVVRESIVETWNRNQDGIQSLYGDRMRVPQCHDIPVSYFR